MTDQSDALRIASDFLAAQAAVDLDAARGLCSADYEVVSPGGGRAGLAPLFERLRTTYRSLEKQIHGQDVSAHDGDVVVSSYGEMVGERNDSGAFSGVRFLDRLVIRDGKVATQQIWNDFGQARPQQRQAR